MPDLLCSVDAVLQRGQVLNLISGMPIAGYNPEVFVNNADIVEVTMEFERQNFNNGASFRRETFRNAANDIVRVGAWFLENPPVIGTLTPATGSIGTRSLSVTIAGSRFGADAAQIRVFMLYTPRLYGRQVLLSNKELNSLAATITTVADTSIVCTFDLTEMGGRSFDPAGQTFIIVDRVERQLRSDRMAFTLTGVA